MSDIVYFVKPEATNEELRYSLRSLANFPHGKVWFYGYCPKYLKPDKYIPVLQNKDNKWQNVGMMIRMVVNNDNISEDFWLFNDDFFVMKPVKKPVNYHGEDLYKRIVSLENCYDCFTPYSEALRMCAKELEALGTTTRSYELHTPMLINRKKAQELHKIADSYGFRSLYGNYTDMKSEYHRDVKITSLTKTYKDGEYLSTSDRSFTEGKVGKQIRELFKDKCKYEK